MLLRGALACMTVHVGDAAAIGVDGSGIESGERRDPGQCPPDQERVDFVAALVGVDRFCVSEDFRHFEIRADSIASDD
jgi:hypothetical protein